MKLILRLTFCLSIIVCLNLNAQIVTNNAFLKGNYVEVGIAPCGSFGSSVAAPSGYHPRGTGASSSANQLGFVANVAKNNWASYVGDYFLPGTPEEGWGLTINGTSYNNNLICSSPVGIQGGFINYTNSSGQISATWQGYVAGLAITAKTYIPVNSLFFVTEVTIQNTSSNPIDNIFYMRNVDPDHGVLTPGGGGGYSTNNSIVYQTPNSCNRALVSATTLSGNYYLGLGSIDSRARVTSGGFSNRSARDIWYGTGFLTSGSRSADEAISVSFNIGTLQPNQSTKLAYAYILDAAQLSQALAATNINLNLDGVSYTTGNSTDVCSGTALPINLTNTGNYTSWNWSPSTGLNTTTGTSVIATLTAPITYTATGTGACGTTSVEINLNPVIQPTPGGAGSISGLSVIGLGQQGNTYQIASVSNATSYVWTLPPGAVVTSSRIDSNVITFNAPFSTWCGDITVKPKNSCGSGTESSIPVCISNIATGVVSSPMCGGATLSVPISTPLGYFLAGNIFTAQLSDSSGNFSNPIPIGNITATSSTFINSTIPLNTLSGNKYRIRVISSSPATIGTDNGSNLTINAAVTPQITITSNQTSICSSTVINFSASIQNGGNSPTYQWKKNGVNVGTNTATYTDNTLINGDIITCALTSNAICATTNSAASNSITITSAPVTPAISISSNKSIICAGTSVQFTANVSNGGTSPTFQWRKNGNNVGTNSQTYIDAGLTNSDIISCTLTSNATCITTTTANSNNISLVVTENLTPSITISSNVDTICSGSNTLIQFTSIPVNGGSNPKYQWRLNGNNITGANNSTFTTNIIGSNDIISCILTSSETCLTSQTATSNSKSIVITPSVTPTISISATQTEICNATSLPTVTYTAVVSNQGINPVYQWKKNGINVGTNTSTYTDNSYSNGTVISCVLTVANSASTCLTSNSVTSNSITMSVSNSVTPTILIFQSNTACSGGATLFTSSVSNAGSTPIYQWKKNGINVGTNTSTYTDNTLVTGDIITCVLTSSAACTTTANVTSNSINVVVTPSVTPSIIISASQSVLCSSTTSSSVAFRATTTNGGTSPYYQWYFNGSLVAASNTNSVTLTGITAGSNVYCTVTSNATCPVPTTATSNTINFTSATIITPTLSIQTITTNVCSGTSVTFNAISYNGGTGAIYYWYKNGSLMQSSTNSTYTTTSLINNDVITCTMASNLSCASPTSVNSSNSITMTVNPVVTPTITISASQTTVCANTNIVFTANTTNAGTNPTFVWRKNGVIVGTNSSSYSNSSWLYGDYIYCTVTNNTSQCLSTPTASSNTIYIYTSTPLTPTISITATSTTICSSSSSITFTAITTNAGTAPIFQWKKNGINVGVNSSTYTTNNLLNNDEISCTLTSSVSCVTTTTAISNNIILSSSSSIPSLLLTASQTTICPSTNPYIIFTATATNAGTYQYYTWRKNGTIVSANNYGSGSANFYTYCLTGDIITSEITSSDGTCINSYPLVSNSITLISSSTPVPSISISTNNTFPICANSGSITFTPVITNAGSNALLTWKKNGITLTSTYSTLPYSINTFTSGDIISCTVSSSMGCGTSNANSNNITITTTPTVTPTINISASQTNICAGTNIIFTATSTNAGSSPNYLWRKNGISVFSSSSNIYTSNDFKTGDIISCRITSNAICRSTDTANSNSISIIVTGSIPTISITASDYSLCNNGSSTFNASITNAGMNPQYQWKKNGINVGTNSSVYTDNGLTNNDSIWCILTPDVTCLTTIISNKIGIQVLNIPAPIVVSPVSVNCGQSITVSATTTTGNFVKWYSNPTSLDPIYIGNNYTLSPTSTTTIYAEAYSKASKSSLVSTNTSSSSSIDLYSLASYSISGIAVTDNYFFASGSSYTLRMSKNNLSSNARLAVRTNYFSDRSNNKMWQLGNTTSNGNSFSSGTVTRLYELNEDLIQTGNYINLSSPINFNYYGLLAPGEGYLIVYDINTNLMKHINLNDGNVSNIDITGLSITLPSTSSSIYGWSEFNGTDYFIVYQYNNNILRTNLTKKTTSTLQSYISISSLFNLYFDKESNKVFYHGYGAEFSSFYNGSAGYINAISNNLLTACTSTPRVPLVINVTPVNATITPSGNTTLCNTSTLTLSSSLASTYTWQKNANTIVGATSATYSPSSSGSYSVSTTYTNGCTGISSPIIVTINTPATPTINITTPQTSICSGSTQTFTASITNGGTSPIYQWKKNNVNVGTNSITYTDNSLSNGDSISCVLLSNATCITSNTVLSNTIKITVLSVTPSISINASKTSICAGENVVFTANITNAGTAPVLQWRKNGSNVGINSLTYADNAITSTDVIDCFLTSNASCITTNNATSNSISLSVIPVSTPAISIVASQTSICQGASVIFTASGVATGTNPIYQWKRNGINVGNNSTTLSLTNIQNNDVITCFLTSSLSCVTTNSASSNEINMSVSTNITPIATINTTTTSICTGQTVTLNASIVNGGTSPIYQWRKNGINVGTNAAVYSTNTVSNGDIFDCIVISNATCVTTNRDTSNSLTFSVSSPVTPVINIYSATGSNNFCSGSPYYNFYANTTNIGSLGTLNWYKNGVFTGVTSSSYYPASLATGDSIYCIMTSSLNCVTVQNVTSNIIKPIILPLVNPNVTLSASSTAICAGSGVTFTTTATNYSPATISGYNWYLNGSLVASGSSNTYTNTSLKTNDNVYCLVNFSNYTCLTSTTYNTNTITVTVIPNASIAISTTNPVLCNTNSSATFTASISNAGISPIYQWKKNGINVGTNNSSYTDNSLQNNDSIWCILNTSGTCANTITSNKIFITTNNITDPIVSSPINVPCGDSATLTANFSSGNLIRWFNSATSNTPFALGNNVKVKPTTNTTYYVQSYIGFQSKLVSSIQTTGAVITDHDAITGDDRCGIAITNNYVFVTGDYNTGRFDKNTLSGATSFPLRDGFFADLATGNLWQLSSSTSLGNSFSGNAVVNQLYRLSESTLSPTGTTLTLSQPISLSYGEFVAPGQGYVILYASSSTTVYHINLQNGFVTILSTSLYLNRANSEGWASYGWSEFDGTNYYIAYKSASTNNIEKVNVSTGVVTIIQSFTNLSDMANIVFDSQADRMYFHHEGSSQFGGSSETVGYVGVSVVNNVVSASCVSSKIPLQVNLTSAPAPTIISSGSTTFCNNSSLTLTSTIASTYQWIKDGNDISGATNQTFSPAISGKYRVKVTNSSGCISTSDSITVTVLPMVSPAISISANQTTICAGTNIVFTASATNAGNSPSYQWKKNGVNVGSNSITYNDNALLSGDIISCVLTSNANCISNNSATSNTITVTVNSANPSITITTSSTSVCSGNSVSFSANTTNAGTNPTYQWFINGNPVGTNAASFTTSSLPNGAVVNCLLTSNATCASSNTAISNNISMNVNNTVTPSITISTSQTSICSGTGLSFSASVTNGGSSPIYQWRKNGVNVGTNSNSYTDNSLSNGDIITCQLTSSASCTSSSFIISTPITISVTQTVTPTITISSNQTDFCSGSAAIFNASITNGGTAPTYQWRKNGILVGTNTSSYTDNTPTNGASITCTLISNVSCATSTTVISNTIFTTVNTIATPAITISSSTSSSICAGSNVTFTAFATNGGTSPTYQWKRNGVSVGLNATNYTVNNLTNGETISCQLLSSRPCITTTTATSNTITVSVTNPVTPSVSLAASQSTVCAGTTVTFTATPTNGGTSPTYVWRVNGNSISNSGATYTTTLNASTTVSCTLYTSLTCATASNVTSNEVSVTVNPSPINTVTIFTPNTSILTGTSVTFTAVPTNGGTSPTFQWRKNGINVGTNTNTYTTNSLVNGDIISCTSASTINCATPSVAVSNNITMTVISNYAVAGTIATPTNLPIPGVAVKVSSTDSLLTTANGQYNFSLLAGGNYSISASKNNDIVKASGVNVLDVLLTQRHIAGSLLFNTPYKLIAADVNNSGNINIFDLLFIKRLILGIDTTFAGNRLWAFVDSTTVFTDPTNPFPYSNSIAINNLASTLQNKSFIGVKLGDVNHDLVPTVGVNRNINNNNPVIIYYDTIFADKNSNQVLLALKVKNFRAISGLQYTMEFNKQLFNFSTIKNKALNFDYGIQKATNGMLSFIWADSLSSNKTLADGTVICEVLLEKKVPISIENIHINSTITEAIAFDYANNAHDVIQGSGAIVGAKAYLYAKEYLEIIPNPTNGKVKVKITSTTDKEITLVMSDILGKKVFERKMSVETGINEFIIDLNYPTSLAAGTYFMRALGLIIPEPKKIILTR